MSQRTCPSCREPMATGRLGPVALDLCLTCAGVWFDCGELSQIMGAGPEIVRRLCSKLPPPSAPPPAPPGHRLDRPKCPVCHAGMEGIEFASMRQVSMDSCSFCEGTWATHASLQRLAAALEGSSSWEQAASGADRAYSGTAEPTPRAPRPPAAQEAEACPGCGEPNAPRAAACWACGKPLLGPVVGTCPACRGTMRRLESQGVTFNACEGCGGVLTNPSRFNMLLRQPVEQLETAVLKQLQRLGRGTAARSTWVPSCPECNVGMVLSSLGTLSPRPIPSCPQCFSLFISRDVVAEILLGKRAGAGARALTREAVLKQGLEERLKRARLLHTWRGVVGFSASAGRSYLALRFEDTGQVTLLLLPDRPGAADEVTTVPADTRWE
jgi:Zn-finger nucleic acid-binding protein